MRALRAGVCCVWVLGLLACGSTTDSPGAAGASTGGVGVGGTMSDGGASGSGVAGKSGSSGSSVGGSAGKAGSAAGGSATGGAPEVPTALPALQCAGGEVVYEGTVGGVAISERLKLTGPAAGV
ncbi:MAG: hypothetical protein ABJB12_20660, partial [Pseudomonadota bacterium]